MIGATRGISTLVAALVAGFLLWLATQIGAETAGEYWATYGVIAAAGLVFALSQLLGGWTKWGWPRLSLGVFLLGFLPVLVAGGWVLLARQPADFFNTSNWSRDYGIYGLVADLGNILPAIAFAIGLTFGLMFDTTGPRREVAPREAPARRRTQTTAPVSADRREPVSADRREPVSADRREPVSADRSETARRETADTGDGRAADEPLTAERAETTEEPQRGRFSLRRRRVPAGSERREG